jgi:hypothetical protein
VDVGVAVEETEEILASVRAVLEADGLTRAATGKLRRVGELSDTLDHSLLENLQVQNEIVRAGKVAQRRAEGCDYGIWDVQAQSRLWVVSIPGRTTGLPITVYRHRQFESADELIAFRVESRRKLAAELVEQLGERAENYPAPC